MSALATAHGKIPADGRTVVEDGPMTFSAIRHRLLLSLALAPGPLKLPQLAVRAHLSMEGALDEAYDLVEAGLVSDTEDGWRLRPGVVVSEQGHVGYLVPLDLTPKPCVRFNGETERHYDFVWEAGRVVTLESGR